MPISAARAVACLAFLSLALPVARADLRLVWKVEQTIERRVKPGEKAVAPIAKSYDLTVLLGPDYFSAVGPDVETYVDFKALRIVRVIRKNKSFTDFSLYTEIAFRTAQIRNRLVFQKMQAEGKVKGDPIELVPLEHLVSLRGPDWKVLTPIDAPRMRFEYGGKPLFSASPQGRALEGDEAAWFVRFLRYHRPMHPDILDVLLARKEIPQEFHSYLNNEDLHYTLVASETVPRTFDLAARVAGLSSSATELSEVLGRAAALTPPDFTAKCAGLLEAARVRAKAERPFDALLLETEYTLCTGVLRDDSLAALRAALANDMDAQRFFGAINPDAKALSKAADVLHSLRNKAKAGLATLKFYEASHLTAMGRHGEAFRLLVDTLRETPFLVSGWKELGDAFFQSGLPADAWQCWNAGRRLAPDHPQFAQILELEEKLRTEHPEYF